MIARRTTRKIITRVIVFLIAGAIINVAVAWAAALHIAAPTNNGNPLASGFEWEDATIALEEPGERKFYRWWLVRRIYKPGVELKVLTVVGGESTPDPIRFAQLLPSEYSLQDVRDREMNCRRGDTEPGFLYLDSRGWPCLALRCRWPWFQQADWPRLPLEWGIQFEAHPGTSELWPYNLFGHRAIPLLPIWPGFAINTIFYAAILWLFFAAPGTIRKRRRIKRGLCPACAYPVGSNEVCTECGALVASQSVQTPAEPGANGFERCASPVADYHRSSPANH